MKQRYKTKLRKGSYYHSLAVDAHSSKTTSRPFGTVPLKISTAFASSVHLTANTDY